MAELVVVTGSSHAGKSTLIEKLLGRSGAPAAAVSIDEVIETVDLPPEELWEQGLADAYEAAAVRTAELLAAGSRVLYESTFTYVPPDQRPTEFHHGELLRLAEVAARAGARFLVVQLMASTEDVALRRQQSGRLDGEIVAETRRQHVRVDLGVHDLLKLDTTRLSPDEAAEMVMQLLASPSPF